LVDSLGSTGLPLFLKTLRLIKGMYGYQKACPPYSGTTWNSQFSGREHSLPSFIYTYSCEFNELIMSNGAILCQEEKLNEILGNK